MRRNKGNRIMQKVGFAPVSISSLSTLAVVRTDTRNLKPIASLHLCDDAFNTGLSCDTSLIEVNASGSDLGVLTTGGSGATTN